MRQEVVAVHREVVAARIGELLPVLGEDDVAEELVVHGHGIGDELLDAAARVEPEVVGTVLGERAVVDRGPAVVEEVDHVEAAAGSDIRDPGVLAEPVLDARRERIHDGELLDAVAVEPIRLAEVGVIGRGEPALLVRIGVPAVAELADESPPRAEAVLEQRIQGEPRARVLAVVVVADQEGRSDRPAQSQPSRQIRRQDLARDARGQAGGDRHHDQAMARPLSHETHSFAMRNVQIAHNGGGIGKRRLYGGPPGLSRTGPGAPPPAVRRPPSGGEPRRARHRRDGGTGTAPRHRRDGSTGTAPRPCRAPVAGSGASQSGGLLC